MFCICIEYPITITECRALPGSDEMVEVEADECEIGGGIEGGPMSPM